MPQVARLEVKSRPARVAARAHRWLLLVAALCILRLWGAPLVSSFWVDEMGTVFVVQHGANDPTLRVAPQVPASIYYALPAIGRRILGHSEFAYRLPSLLAMVVALFFIGKIAARLIHPDAAWFAVFASFFLRDFNFEAADARPYALATCVAAAALFFLIRWMDSARWRDAAVFAVLAALLWRVHLTLWPIYLLFAIYTAARLLRHETAVGWARATLVFVAIGLALVPVLWTALDILRGAKAHVVADEPDTADLSRALRLSLIVPICAGAALVARWFSTEPGWKPAAPIASPDAWTLILGWWLVHPLAIYAFSKITGNSLFVPRYLYVAMPGAVLVGTLAAAAFIPASQWRNIALAIGILALATMGRWTRPALEHSGSDWRAAAQALRQAAGASDAPVVCPSPFIEARWPVWRPDYPIASFLYAQLLYYRVPGKPYPFPYTTWAGAGPEATAYAAGLARGDLARAGRFFIYGGDRGAGFWRTFFSARPEFAGWYERRVALYGDVEVDEFSAKPPAPTASPVERVPAAAPAPLPSGASVTGR
ncbi:MAG TPA: glycosyltransferase family 39 protein [Bryobacteraceae bacterium]|nr:glycosyltransferase family 39 protein [Bryobacteraceae bacterium]